MDFMPYVKVIIGVLIKKAIIYIKPQDPNLGLPLLSGFCRFSRLWFYCLTGGWLRLKQLPHNVIEGALGLCVFLQVVGITLLHGGLPL